MSPEYRRTGAKIRDEAGRLATVREVAGAGLLGEILDEREQRIIEARYLSPLDLRPTLKQLGQELEPGIKVTGERVRQIETKALGKLRALVNNEPPPRPDSAVALKEPLPDYVINPTGFPDHRYEIDILGLSPLARNLLTRRLSWMREEVSIREIDQMSDEDLLRLRGMGQKTLGVVKEKLELFRQRVVLLRIIQTRLGHGIVFLEDKG